MDGRAEEAAEAGPPASTLYNVREYQNPDAGAADRPLAKAAAKDKKGATSTTFV